jgi:GNAT superfamily N-acetyltransferase
VSVDIRVATEEDWPLVWPFFAAVVEAGETYAYPEDMTAETGRALWMEQPPGRTVVAVEAGTVLGSAKMGPNRPGRGAHVATASFMVDPAHGGRGVGRALGLHAVDWARAGGYRAMQCNAVVETNVAAVPLAVAGVRDPRDRAGGVRPPSARPGRALRHVPAPLSEGAVIAHGIGPAPGVR